VVRGKNRKPPIHAPALVGALDITPIIISFHIVLCLLLVIGDTIALYWPIQLK